MIVSLWDRAQLAEDTGVEDAGGWGGITLAYNTRSPAEVDAVLAEVAAAGGTVLRPGARDLLGRLLRRVRRSRGPRRGRSPTTRTGRSPRTARSPCDPPASASLANVRRLGGSDGNEQLTAVVATLLLVLLAIEGATLLNLTVAPDRACVRRDAAHPGRRAQARQHRLAHAPLLPRRRGVRAGAGRRIRCYGSSSRRSRSSRRSCSSAPVSRCSPLDQTSGTVVGLHKASFVVWLGAVGVHVLVRVVRLPEAFRLGVPGSGRSGSVLAAATLVAGVAVATLTLPAADHLQDQVSAHVGFDGG